MKNSVKALIVLIISFYVLTAQAQIFGVEGGIGIANFGSPSQSARDALGAALGLKIWGTVEFDITDDFYLGSGLGFSKKGASTVSGNFNLLYLDIPLQARYEFFDVGGSGIFFASGGLNLGFLISAHFDGNRLDIGNSSGDNVKGFDLGLATGAGVNFEDRFQVSLNTVFGLVDISSADDSKLKNITLMVTFVYKLDL